MPRIPAVDPATVTGRAKEIFEGPLKGKTFNIFKSMAASPAVLDAYLGMSGALNGTTLSAKEREVIQLAIGEANNCGYCAAAHTAIGKGAGLTEDQTVEARRGKMTDPKLGALARFSLAIHEKKGFISDTDAAEFTRAGYSQAQMGEVVATYALAVFTNYFNHLNETTLDFPQPPRL
ncbi:MAG: carboxymuconolactone decarboxylase family protein [Phycisphaerales bacterium]